MPTEIQTTDFRQTFRDSAAAQFHAAADMSLHQLVDEYLRLSNVINIGVVKQDGDDEYGPTKYTDEAELAIRVRNVVNGAAKARFGLSLATYDYGPGAPTP